MSTLFTGSFEGCLPTVQGRRTRPRPQTSSCKENRQMKIIAFAMLFTLLLIDINALANSDNQRRLFDRSSVVRGLLSVAPLSTSDHEPLTTDPQPRSAVDSRQLQIQKSAIRNPQSPSIHPQSQI